MKLISMVDYVFEMRKNQNKDNITRFWACETYAKFLSMPLTLGMFVPTNKNNNILQQPDNYGAFYAGMSSKDFNYNVMECQQFSEALSNIVFEGFEFMSKPSDYFFTLKMSFDDFYQEITFVTDETIEDLLTMSVDFDWKLTQSAITKYQI